MGKTKSILLALLSGLLLGISWPGITSLGWLSFLGFVPLLCVEHAFSKESKSVLLPSFLSFFVWNLIGLNWLFFVNEALITQIISIAAPVLVNTMLMTITFVWFSSAKKRLPKKVSYLIFVALWMGYEYFQINYELSNPWMGLGNVFADNHKMIQWYEYTGILGGALWVLVMNVIIAKTIIFYAEKKRVHMLNIFAGLMLLVIPIGISHFLYKNVNLQGEEINVTVIQPNIDPYFEKFTGSAEDQIDIMLHQSKNFSNEKTDYIVGPETAMPYSIWAQNLSQTPLFKKLKSQVDSFSNQTMVMGASVRELYTSQENLPISARPLGKDKWYDSFNSAITINKQDSIQMYHKSKLVLGVERMPFPKFFKQFQNLIFDLGGTTGTLGSQKEREVFHSSKNKAVVAPVICFESVYGEFVGEYIEKGANVIFILTNDGWWDYTAGHVQHFLYAKLRAIEHRRSIARSANTGVSGFILPNGDVVSQTEYWVPTALNASIPLNSETTFYSKNGDLLGRVGAFLAIAFLLWSFVKKRTANSISLK